MIFARPGYNGLVINRPWRTLYHVAVLVLAIVWLGWPGAVVAIAAGLNYNPKIDWISL